MTLSSADKRAVSGLVGDVARLQRDVKLLASSKPGLAQSSIENGSVDGYDVEGNQTVQIGKQQDGTHASTSLSGPKPPTPYFPSARAVPGVVEVRWNGKFAGGLVSPMDFKHTAAYVVPVGALVNLSDQSGVMTGELGDSVQVQAEAGVHDVYLAAWSLSGKVSDLAGPVSVVVPVPLDSDLVNDALDRIDTALDEVQASVDGKTTIRNATTAPVGDGTADGDRWQKWSTLADGGALLQSWRWTGTEWVAEVMDPTYLPKVDIGAGTFGELDGDRLKANSILADRVVVGVGNNALPDPMFLSDAANYNRTSLSTGEWSQGISGVDGLLYFRNILSTGKVVWEFGTGGAVGASQGIATLEGDRWVMRTGVNANGTKDPTNSVRWGVRLFAPDESFTLEYGEPVSGVAGRFTIVHDLVVPAGVIAFMPFIEFIANTASTYVYSGAFIGQRSTGELIVDGAITADKLAANSVQASNVAAGAIDGQVITSAVIQSPGAGAGYQLTENGYTSRDADGNVTVRLPSDGSTAQFRGDLEAKSLTASGRVSLQAPENEVASGAAMVLEAGVTPPLSPPTVGVAFESTRVEEPQELRADVSGLAYAAGLWWRGVNVLGGAEGDRIEGLDDTGAVVVSRDIGLDPRGGIAAIGSELFVLGKRHDRPDTERWVAVYTVAESTTSYQRWFQYPSYGSGTYQPGIGTDGTNVLVAQCWSDGKLTWRSYNKTTGTQNGQVDSGSRVSSDIAAIYVGNGDFGVKRAAVTRVDGTTNVFTTAGVNVSNAGWKSAGNATVSGATFVDGSFRHLTAQGDLVTYSNFQDAGGDTNDWWAAITWTGVGGAETQAGPPQRFQYLRRSELQVSVGKAPMGATGVRLYLGRQNNVPGRTDLHIVASGAGSTVRLATLPPTWGSLPNPPNTNTFNTESPGEIRARSTNFVVRGDGTGKWGPLTFNADGSMTSTATPAWVPITSFLNGCSVGDFGFVPSYRSWPDGKVELRGIVKGPIGGGGGFRIADLPTRARPPYPVDMTAAASYVAGVPAVMRIEFGAVNNPDSITVVAAGVAREWVSLDGLYYYLV